LHCVNITAHCCIAHISKCLFFLRAAAHTPLRHASLRFLFRQRQAVHLITSFPSSRLFRYEYANSHFLSQEKDFFK
jgi:hypothetical protein